MDALNLLNEAMETEFLSEAYFGKNKNLIKIEKLFDEIVEKNKATSKKIDIPDKVGIKNNTLKKIANKAIDSSQPFKKEEDINFALANFKKIEKIIKDEFGFNFVNLQFANLITDLNPSGKGRRGGFAFTMGQFCVNEIAGSGSYEVKATADGVKYIKDIFGMSTFLDDSVFDGTFTGGEITSIVLHEIGHNFFRNNNMSHGLLGATALAIALATCSKVNGTKGVSKKDLDVILTTIGITGLIGPIIAALKETGLIDLFSKVLICGGPIFKIQQLSLRLQKMYKIFKNDFFKKYSIIDEFNKYYERFTGTFAVSNIIDAIDGTSNEKFADVFATAYGYGPESISASHKIDGAIDWNIPGFNTATDLLSLPARMFAFLTDVHPNSYQRMKDQIKYAKAQVSSVREPKIKKALLDNIDKMESEIKIAEKTMLINNLKQGRVFSFVFNIITMSILRGVSPHSLIPTNRKLTHALDFRKSSDWAQFKSTEKNIINRI